MSRTEAAPESLNEDDVERRRDAALLRALSTPHKRQSEMKLGRAKKRTAPGSKISPTPNASDA
jgi:hypothetical protein